ncbi:MAG: hypothetical protein Q7K26_02115 [bacterium]|nr:hypothetical protein [bacterium]
MARETPTRTLVREIAMAAFNRGEKPTQAMIKRIIFDEHGITASPNVVLDEFNQFMSEIGKMGARRFSLPDLPAEVAEAITVVWELACQKSNDQVAHKIRQVEEREHQTEQSIKKIEAVLAEEKVRAIGLVHDLALATQAAEQKNQMIDSLRAECYELKIKLESTIERNTELSAEKIRIESTCVQRITEIETNLRAELVRVRSEHERTVEQLNVTHQADAQAWDGMRKHLLTQTDMIRQSAKNSDEHQRNLIADLELRTGVLTRKANDATQEVSRMSGMVEVLNGQLQKLEQSDKKLRLDCSKYEKHISSISQWLAFKAPHEHEAFLLEFGPEVKPSN